MPSFTPIHWRMGDYVLGTLLYRAKRSVKATAEVTEFVLPWLTGRNPCLPVR